LRLKALGPCKTRTTSRFSLEFWKAF
jgi:hypothetical protein